MPSPLRSPAFPRCLLPLLLTGACGDPPDTSATDSASPTPTEAAVEGVYYTLHEEIGSLAYVTWNQTRSAETWVECSPVEGDTATSTSFEAITSPATSTMPGTAVQLVAGIPFETTATCRVANDFGAGPVYSEPFSLQTDPLPQGFPEPTLHVAEESAWNVDDRYLIGSVNQREGGWEPGTFWKFILDRAGNVLWALSTPSQHWTLFIQISRDGEHILYDELTYWSSWDQGEESQVHRITLDNTEVATYDTPGAHHPFTELPDESIVWAAIEGYNETLERLHPSGEQEEIWSCATLMDDWNATSCWGNGLYYDETTDTFLFSVYTFDSVIWVDGATGETLHVWGQMNGAWDFEPEDSTFWWQHGVSFTDEGNLLLSTRVSQDEEETAVREYALDEESEVLEEVWSFGEGEGLYAATAGDAHRLDNGNTLHNYGSLGVIREVTTEGEVVWDVRFEEEHLVGRTAFFEDLYALVP